VGGEEKGTIREKDLEQLGGKSGIETHTTTPKQQTPKTKKSGKEAGGLIRVGTNALREAVDLGGLAYFSSSGSLQKGDRLGNSKKMGCAKMTVEGKRSSKGEAGGNKGWGVWVGLSRKMNPYAAEVVSRGGRLALKRPARINDSRREPRRSPTGAKKET